jgi:hypothetical protein
VIELLVKTARAGLEDRRRKSKNVSLVDPARGLVSSLAQAHHSFCWAGAGRDQDPKYNTFRNLANQIPASCWINLNCRLARMEGINVAQAS